MTIGDAYYYKNKYDELEAEYIRLTQLYGEQQAVIEKYQANWGKQGDMRYVRFEPIQQNPSLRTQPKGNTWQDTLWEL